MSDKQKTGSPEWRALCLAIDSGELVSPAPRNEWLCGYAVALAEVNRQSDNPTLVAEVLRSAGLTLAELKRIGIDKFDLDELRKCVKP